MRFGRQISSCHGSSGEHDISQRVHSGSDKLDSERFTIDDYGSRLLSATRLRVIGGLQSAFQRAAANVWQAVRNTLAELMILRAAR